MTTNKTVLAWVDEAVALCKPEKVLWIDGSEAQADAIRQDGLKTGELITLNQEKLPGCVLHRSDPNDVARVEDRTFICTRREIDVWQYRWALPQYLKLMASAVGGEDQLANELDHFFQQHLNNQGNEPGLHAPFIFNRLHHPHKTQQYITQILHEESTNMYGGNAEYPQPVIRKIFMNAPKGYLPEMDEDDGTMSAWYVFSTLGIFPLVVGEPVYELTSPSFDHSTIRLDNGRVLKIKAQKRKSINNPVKEIRLNGKTLTDFQVQHDELVKGGKLIFYY